MVDKKRIIIFGFSGAGKSSIANMLGRRLGMKVVHSSGILRDLYAGKVPDLSSTKYARGFWETDRGRAFLRGRLKETKPLDLELDKILIQELDKGDIVLDCWSMPWLYHGGFKVYLESSLKERAARVAKRGGISVGCASNSIKSKDKDTVQLIKKFYNVNIEEELGVFDLVVKTDDLDKPQIVNRIIKAINA